MSNITLISTFHSELGKCNANELYKILKTINPDVIFEELPQKLFKTLYDNPFTELPVDVPLELKCVKNYLKNHTVKHFPVDIESKQILTLENFFRKHPQYNKLLNDCKKVIFKEGFPYLNSDSYIEYHEKKTILENQILKFSKQNELLIAHYNQLNFENEKRENAMLKNIHTVYKEYKFENAVFLLGVGHRKSMIQKVYDKNIKNLNWTIYDPTKKGTQ